MTRSTTISASVGRVDRGSATRDLHELQRAPHVGVRRELQRDLGRAADRLRADALHAEHGREACSSGRVTVVRKTSGGAPPVRATTTMRGNSTSG